ncbi:MAG: replication factor A [Candidatus Micrarchaeota archaeon]|nr:MAG: replication factor A [Candidatus Micrarchaeota archaeon]
MDDTSSYSVLDILDMIDKIKSSNPDDLLNYKKQKIQVSDKALRLFNIIEKGDKRYRRVLLGDDAINIRLTAFNKQAEMFDNLLIERGSKITITNVSINLDITNPSLKTSSSSYIYINEPSNIKTKSIAEITETDRDFDIIAQIIEISGMRYVTSKLTNRSIASATAKLSDSTGTITAFFNGRSAEILQRLHVSDIVKIEYCKTKKTNDNRIFLIVSESSRILANQRLKDRMK